jgi:LDH2 family malate/lactate/ureidoglycolate dehydrogenase
MTDLRAVETHGVSNMLRVYVQDYKAGKLNPAPGWHIVRETPGTAVLMRSGLASFWGPSHASGRSTTGRCRVVTMYNSGHFGAIGHHATIAAEQDMIGVCYTGAGLSVVPTFASKPLLGTVDCHCPPAKEAPLLFDVATGYCREQDPSGHPCRLAALTRLGHGQRRQSYYRRDDGV